MARRVVVLDDSALFLKMMRLALESEGHQVMTGRVATDAVRRVGVQSPDLLILDITLRNQRRAAAILRSLRIDAALARLPVIVCVTGHELIEEQRETLDALGASVLTKPFDIATLLRMVDAMHRRGVEDAAEAACQ